MSVSHSRVPEETVSSGASAASTTGATAAEIDASCRWPLVLLFTSGILWLVLGTVFALLSEMKIHMPQLASGPEWLTYGRIRPASANMLLYGFASQAGVGVALWLLCRLGRVTLSLQWPVIVAWKLWNIGVTAGVIAILAGFSTGFAWLEIPGGIAGALFVAAAIFAMSAVATFAARRDSETHPSQWYLLAAIFWFPWIYSAANCLLICDPVRGTMQAAVNGWFTGNLVNLWLTPLALAAIFYFLPRLSGIAIASRQTAAFSFWTLLFLGNLGGLTGLLGGPVPKWMPAVSVGANIALLAAVVGNLINLRPMCCPVTGCATPKNEPAYGFIRYSALAYVLLGVLTALTSIPAVAALTNFTYVTVAKNNLAIHGVAGLVLLGSIYYILPRLLQVNWASECSIGTHFKLALAGVVLTTIGVGVGGVIQGAKLANATLPFIDVARSTFPWVGMHILGLILLLVGQAFLLVNLFKLFKSHLQPIAQALCSEWCCAGSKSGVRS